MGFAAVVLPLLACHRSYTLLLASRCVGRPRQAPPRWTLGGVLAVIKGNVQSLWSKDLPTSETLKTTTDSLTV